MGVKTRNKKKASNAMIVRRRNGKQEENMSRSSKKGAFVDASLMKKVQAMKKADKKKPIKT